MEFLTPKELAIRWNVPVSTVWRYLRKKRIKCFKLGSIYKISIKEVEKFENGD